MGSQPSLATNIDVHALRQLLAGTTKGQWRSLVEGRDHASGSSFIMTGVGSAGGNDIQLSGASVADQDFIASAHEIMPTLLDEIEYLRNLFAK